MVGQNIKLNCIYIKDIVETVLLHEFDGRQNAVVVGNRLRIDLFVEYPHC